MGDSLNGIPYGNAYFTVTFTVFLKFSALMVIVAVPFAFAVTKPFASTLATDSSLEVYVISVTDPDVIKLASTR